MPQLTLSLHINSFGKNALKAQEFHLAEVHGYPGDDSERPFAAVHKDLHLAGPAHGFKKGVVK